jgi:hypothetical protein
VVMRPEWLGVDVVAERTAELMRLMEVWRPAEEAQRAAEEERLRVMWEGIEAGPVELTEAATVERGGLRMLRADGSVVLEVVELLEIEGEFARVRTTGGRGGYAVMELLRRGDIEGMQELNHRPEEQVIEHPAAQYWSVE